MRIHAIQTGTVQLKRRQTAGAGGGRTRVLRTMLDRRWTEPLPILAWLIEHPEGLVLVDTGETARAATTGWFPRWQPYFRFAVRFDVAPQDEVGPQLRAKGFEPTDVATVILTHLHCDHADGIGHFPQSAVLVNRVEHERARGLAGQIRGYLPHRWPPAITPRLVDFDGSAAYGTFEGSSEVVPGVRLVPTPGHTAGHMSVIVDDGDRTLFLAGDVSYNAQLLREGAVDGVTDDPRTAAETVDRVRRFVDERGAVYLPTHDPGSPERLRGG